jgi:hypothetical protein
MPWTSNTFLETGLKAVTASIRPFQCCRARSKRLAGIKNIDGALIWIDLKLKVPAHPPHACTWIVADFVFCT